MLITPCHNSAKIHAVSMGESNTLHLYVNCNVPPNHRQREVLDSYTDTQKPIVGVFQQQSTHSQPVQKIPTLTKGEYEELKEYVITQATGGILLFMKQKFLIRGITPSIKNISSVGVKGVEKETFLLKYFGGFCTITFTAVYNYKESAVEVRVLESENIMRFHSGVFKGEGFLY